MLILPAEADESVVATAVDRIAKAVSESGGEVTKVDRWGRRRFAYEINDQTEGYYLVVEFSAEPSTQVEMERVLALADEVIRFKVLVRPATKAAKSRKGGTVARTEAAPEVPKAEEIRAVEPTEAPEEAEAPQAPEAPEAPEAEEEKEASPAPA